MPKSFLPILVAGFFVLNFFHLPLLVSPSRPSFDICGCHAGVREGRETENFSILQAAVCGTTEEQNVSFASSKDFLLAPIQKSEGHRTSSFVVNSSLQTPNFLQDLALDKPPRFLSFFSL